MVVFGMVTLADAEAGLQLTRSFGTAKLLEIFVEIKPPSGSCDLWAGVF
jgi:hypothetical protein